MSIIKKIKQIASMNKNAKFSHVSSKVTLAAWKGSPSKCLYKCVLFSARALHSALSIVPSTPSTSHRCAQRTFARCLTSHLWSSILTTFNFFTALLRYSTLNPHHVVVMIIVIIVVVSCTFTQYLAQTSSFNLLAHFSLMLSWLMPVIVVGDPKKSLNYLDTLSLHPVIHIDRFRVCVLHRWLFHETE